MPGCGVHLRLASQILNYWDAKPACAPFPIGDKCARNAFLAGSNAPDMGYYPTCDPLLTDFSHYIRSADLARNLVRLADTPVETGFAWGWVTHILGDALIHPLVNQAVGEWKRGSRDQRMNYHDDPVAHVQVEVGMGAFLLIDQGWQFTKLPGDVFDESSIVYLQRAYRETYGVSFALKDLFKAHHSVTSFTPRLLDIDHIVGSSFTRRHLRLTRHLLAWFVYFPVKVYSTFLQRKTFLYGITHTVRPAEWFAQAVTEEIGGFADRFQQLVDDGLKSLPHFNLDLGEVEGDDADYPLTLKARRDLEEMQSADQSSDSTNLEALRSK